MKLDDYAVGAWMRRQRKADNLNPDQVAKLDVLDELWRLEPDWNRSYRRLLAYLAAGGTLDGPVNRTGGEADPTFRPGTWLRKQDKARTDGKLTQQQTALLDALHRHTETVAGCPPRTPRCPGPPRSGRPTPPFRGEAVTTQQRTYKPLTVNWCADWYCGDCGSTGEAWFEDGTIVDADHDCDEGDGDQSVGRAVPSAGSAAGRSTPTSRTATTWRPTTTAPPTSSTTAHGAARISGRPAPDFRRHHTMTDTTTLPTLMPGATGRGTQRVPATSDTQSCPPVLILDPGTLADPEERGRALEHWEEDARVRVDAPAGTLGVITKVRRHPTPWPYVVAFDRGPECGVRDHRITRCADQS
ncbi:hypothetical protein P3T27_008106 [Kitasatospora sp. MAA19]|nr:hypothetical protein [Kitasatospora sp. MAA19]